MEKKLPNSLELYEYSANEACSNFELSNCKICKKENLGENEIKDVKLEFRI